MQCYLSQTSFAGASWHRFIIKSIVLNNLLIWAKLLYTWIVPLNVLYDPKEERTVSIRVGGSSSRGLTLVVWVTMDGTKLPLFVKFKGKPGGSVERSLPSILSAGVIGCVQMKARMDDRTWVYGTNSVPTLCGNTWWKYLIAIGLFCLSQIGQFTVANGWWQCTIVHDSTTLHRLQQPCDVGINKSLKGWLKEAASDRCREKHSLLGPGHKLPPPDWKDIL